MLSIQRREALLLWNANSHVTLWFFLHELNLCPKLMSVSNGYRSGYRQDEQEPGLQVGPP